MMIMRDPAKFVIKRDKLIHCRGDYSRTCVMVVDGGKSYSSGDRSTA